MEKLTHNTIVSTVENITILFQSQNVVTIILQTTSIALSLLYQVHMVQYRRHIPCENDEKLILILDQRRSQGTRQVLHW